MRRARISFRVFRVFRGYIPRAAASPAVAGRLERSAADCLREDKSDAAEQNRWSQRRPPWASATAFCTRLPTRFADAGPLAALAHLGRSLRLATHYENLFILRSRE